MTSNLNVIFAEGYELAHGRATVSVTNGLHEVKLDPNFVEGGYYYFTFRKKPEHTTVADLVSFPRHKLDAGRLSGVERIWRSRLDVCKQEMYL